MAEFKRTDISPDIGARYLSGSSTATLAREEKCSPESIKRRLRDMGIQLRPPGARRRYDWAAVIAAYESGLNYRQVGQKFGMHFSGVYRIVNEYREFV